MFLDVFMCQEPTFYNHARRSSRSRSLRYTLPFSPDEHARHFCSWWQALKLKEQSRLHSRKVRAINSKAQSSEQLSFITVHVCHCTQGCFESDSRDQPNSPGPSPQQLHRHRAPTPHGHPRTPASIPPEAKNGHPRHLGSWGQVLSSLV